MNWDVRTIKAPTSQVLFEEIKVIPRNIKKQLLRFAMAILFNKKYPRHGVLLN
tara:strand:+ start:362 stop:520 length:159 start_codon:yes stop_codon:yes gene_type:complete